MADSKGIQRGGRLKNRNREERLVVLNAQPADEWLAGEEEKNTCEQSDLIGQSNRTCCYAPIKLAVQEPDGIICRAGSGSPCYALKSPKRGGTVFGTRIALDQPVKDAGQRVNNRK